MAFRISLNEQIALFLYAAIIGIIIGLVYDIFRISRVMMTGVGIGGQKNSSKRLDMITERLRKGVKPRRESKLKSTAVNIAVFFEDILFCVISAVIFIIFIYHANYGQTRLYLFVSAILGFLLYYNTAGKLVAKISGLVVSLVKLVIAFAIYKVIRPAVGAAMIPYRSINRRRLESLGKKEMKKLSAQAKCGFGY